MYKVNSRYQSEPLYQELGILTNNHIRKDLLRNLFFDPIIAWHSKFMTMILERKAIYTHTHKQFFHLR